ncbi:MAG: Holliday junction branch migration protein RuvA [Gammaproteobacteria bacterium]|nr:Holliday junction branch migration protein RuvA [Gammaproteobacteria bacterium]
MIGSLRGRLTFKHAPAIIIECHGVGYDIETPMSTFFELPAVGEELFLFAHLLVREDAQILYGFATQEERALFRTLLKVRGVGARIGLAVLSAMSVSDFNRCIEYEDASALSKIPGIGKKTAERLIIEMRDRIDTNAGNVVRINVEKGAKSEAVDALVALGYKPAEVNKLIAKLDVDGQSAEDIIRLALRQAAG